MFLSEIVAIDIGNGHTDVMSGYKDIVEFPSLVKKASDRPSYGDTATPLTTSFGEYFVGRDCLGEPNESRTVDSSFYSSETARVLFINALSHVKTKTPTIVTGLPTGLWQLHRDPFKERLIGWAREEGLRPEEVLVLPQHAGPYYDPLVLDDQGTPLSVDKMFKGGVLVIDIGRGTIDCGLFEDGRPKDVAYGEPEGVHSIYSAVVTSLKNGSHDIFDAKKRKKMVGVPEDFMPRKDMDVEILDQWVREGFYIYQGSRYSVRPLMESECRRYCEVQLQKCLSKLPDINYMNAVICAGGGPAVIGKDLLSHYVKTPIYVPDSPNYSVVRGFYEYALLRAQTRKDIAHG